MSNTFQNIPVGKQAMDLDISPQFEPYSGVEIITGEDASVFAGNRSGRVLQIENAWGTQEQANAILSSITSTGFQYQPFKASGAIVNPAAEIGDGVTVNGVYSGIYKMSRSFGSLMFADIEAPQDETIDHEYPFEAKQDRIYKREISDARASISINENAITAEVLRATTAEGTLSSRITQNATSINAKVSQTGGDNSSFGWSLLNNKFSLYSGNKEVFKCTSSGVEINGKITATSGYIGNGSSGFTITASAMYNGMGNINSGANGIYIGTDGIALGGGKFKAKSDGTITAKGLRLQGSLTFLNSDGSTAGTMTAADLRAGAARANAGYSSWNGTTSTVNSNGGYWSGGAAGGYKFNNATNSSSGSYPDYFRANQIACTQIGGTTATFSSVVARDSFYLGSTRALHLVPKSSATYVVGY